MDGMHFPLKKWAVRAIQSHIDTHYIEMMSMNDTAHNIDTILAKDSLIKIVQISLFSFYIAFQN